VKNANLCWGQRYMWLRYHQLPSHARHEAHIVLNLGIPAGFTIARIRSALSYLVRRHETLRTTFHLESDPEQRVSPPAILPLVQATTERDGTATPAEVVERISSTEFDLSREWPIRACVITTAGAPKQLVLVLNHVAFDAWSIEQLEREITALGAGVSSGRPATLEPVRHQPSDLARYESAAEATAVKERALAYWAQEFSTLPADTFDATRTNDAEPIARNATLTSPAMLDASRRIAGREQVWPSLVHVTAYNMLIAAYTGSGTVAHLSFTGQRDAGQFAETMTCMFSPLPMSVDCHDDPPFSELLRRTAQRAEQARSHSYFPYDELLELMSHESFRRGRELRIGSEVNFIGRPHLPCRASRTTFTWNSTPSAWAHYGSDTYYRIYEWRDAVVVGLNAVSTVMDAGAMERFLRGHEAVLLAHVETSTDLRVSEVARMVGFPAVRANRRPCVDGDGPNTEPMPATSEAQRALGAVVQKVNGLDDVNLSHSYTVAGGKVLRIPRVLAMLQENGWGGLSVYQIASALPLRALADLLSPVR